VTIRDRDTKRQVRVGIDEVAAFVDMVKRGASFSEAAEALKAAPV
jgi:glycyl-tRNA synthetase